MHNLFNRNNVGDLFCNNIFPSNVLGMCGIVYNISQVFRFVAMACTEDNKVIQDSCSLTRDLAVTLYNSYESRNSVNIVLCDVKIQGDSRRICSYQTIKGDTEDGFFAPCFEVGKRCLTNNILYFQLVVYIRHIKSDTLNDELTDLIVAGDSVYVRSNTYRINIASQGNRNGILAEKSLII
ncbi:hypothetical protein F4703DRAFT_1790082 [Phycomyces blakesleeanus]